MARRIQHTGIGAEFLRAMIARLGNNGIITRGGKSLSKDNALAYLAAEIALGRTMLPAYAHTDAQGRCLGHEAKPSIAQV